MRNRLAAWVSMVGVMTATGLAQAPAGKVATDVRKTCQVTVPADWTYEVGTAYSPDKKISATVHGLRGQSFAQGKDTIKLAMKPLKVLQDDDKRLLYTMDPGPVAPGKTGWYVIANTTPVCSLSFTFTAGADEALLRKIADSLAPAAATK